MVKNITGGSKSKKMASKNFKVEMNTKKLRKAEDENEIYAIITEKLGGGHLRCFGINGNKYMVHIGGKFRNVRYNRFDFVLIGLREWQTSSNKNKEEMTDLLEVYDENEKNKLLKINGFKWNLLLKQDTNYTIENNNEDSIKFSNEIESDYKDLLEKEINTKLSLTHKKQIDNDNDEDETIDFSMI